jgi:hypothetical protein
MKLLPRRCLHGTARAGVLVFAACALAPFMARAERSMGLDYVAPPDCPRSTEFAAAVAALTGGAWRLHEGAAEEGLIVRISGDGGGKVGVLGRAGDRAATAPREMRAADCGDLVRALALTAALSLDGERPTTTPSPLTAKQPVTEPVGSPAATSSPRMPPAAVLPPGPAPLTASSPRAPPASPAIPRRLAIGVGVSAADLLPPFLMTGATLFAESSDSSWPRDSFIHRPELSVAISHARNDVLGSEPRARFSLTAAHLAACPFGWVVLRICGTAEAGLLYGRGADVFLPRSDRSLWMAAGGSLKATWTVGRKVLLEAYVSARVPLRRTEFTFEMPPALVASVPALVADGGLAIGAFVP